MGTCRPTVLTGPSLIPREKSSPLPRCLGYSACSARREKAFQFPLSSHLGPLQVESILEQNFLQDKEDVFPLRPDLLSSLGEEDQILTEALVGLSGLEVQRSGPQYAWDPDTRHNLCALYAGLSLLHLLSRDS